MYLHGLVKPASQDPLWGKIPGLSGGAMGGPQPLGTLIISSGKLSRKVWMYLRMSKDGFVRRPPPQDSAQGWVNPVLTFPGLCKRETCFRSLPAKSPGCSHCAQTVWAAWVGGGTRMCREGIGLQGQVGSRLLLGSCELPVLSRLAGLIGAHLCFYGSAEDVSAA